VDNSLLLLRALGLERLAAEHRSQPAFDLSLERLAATSSRGCCAARSATRGTGSLFVASGGVVAITTYVGVTASAKRGVVTMVVAACDLCTNSNQYAEIDCA
jgi:hypothetical protein